jgi:hypothetical protein
MCWFVLSPERSATQIDYFRAIGRSTACRVPLCTKRHFGAMLAALPDPRAYEEPMPIRVLIADDSAIIRKAVRRLLETEPDIQILAEAVDLRQMLELRNKLHPDIVVMDLRTCSMLLVSPQPSSTPFQDPIRDS